jgi:hypothetical protein
MHNNNNQSGWVLLQLLEKYRAVDVDDYQRVKDELAAIQVVFALIGPEVCAVSYQTDLYSDLLQESSSCMGLVSCL